MIDLQKFCGDMDIRGWLNTPFSIGEYTYATNGHILIRVPRVPDQQDHDKPDRLEKILPSFLAEGQLVDIPELPPALGNRVETCDACNGDGLCPRCGEGDCDECDGEGEQTIYESHIAVEVGCAKFSHVYLSLIKGLGVSKVSITTQTDPAKFVFDGGDGLLMPMRY